MPGMNGEVSIETQRRDNALAVSNDAVRSPNEASSVATLLGLNPDSVRAQLASQRGSFAGQRGQPGGAQSAAASGAAQNFQGQSQGQGGGQGRQGGFNLPQVTDDQCQKVTAALAKHPDVQTKLGDLRTKMMNGELDRQAMQAESQKLYASAGVDPQVARACSFRQRQAGRNGQGGAQAGGAPNGGASGGAMQAGQTGRGRGRRGMVFVVKNGKYTPKVVQLGVSNYDVSEVLSGLNEGDSVAILNVAAMQAQQQASLDQVRNRGGVPGLQRQQPQGQGGAGGGAGAGGRPGGGAPRGGGN